MHMTLAKGMNRAFEFAHSNCTKNSHDCLGIDMSFVRRSPKKYNGRNIEHFFLVGSSKKCRTCLDSALENGLVELVADIKNHNSSVIATDGQQRRVLRVEVQTHDARLGSERVLGV